MASVGAFLFKCSSKRGSEKGSTLKEAILLLWSEFFPFKEYFYLQGRQNIFDSYVYPFP